MKYVVYLTQYTGSLLPKFYIGSTSEKRILSGKYFGSVKSKKWMNIFNQELHDNVHLFAVSILSIHDSRLDALNEELRLHIENNVVNSDDYMNESLASPNGFFGRSLEGDNNPFFGKTHSDEFKRNKSESMKGKDTWMKGKTHSEESKRKNSESHKGKPAWNSGKKNPYSPETLERIKNSQQARRLREKNEKS